MVARFRGLDRLHRIIIILLSALGVVVTIFSSPNTMSESSTFAGSMFALSRLDISRISSSVSSPLPPEPVFFDSVTFSSVKRL